MGHDYYGQLGDGFGGIRDNSPVPEQIFPSPPPSLTATPGSAGTIRVAATCRFGGVYQLVTRVGSVAEATPWAAVATNSVTSRVAGGFSVTWTNAPDREPGIRVFRLESD
jgi:hypothetical protein